MKTGGWDSIKSVKQDMQRMLLTTENHAEMVMTYGEDELQRGQQWQTDGSKPVGEMGLQ